MKKFKVCICCLFFLFFLLLETHSQIKIQCGDINLFIPEFKDSFIPVREDPVLIQKKVLSPISESSAELEIRFYNIALGQGRTRVIKCSNSKFTVDNYEVYSLLNNKPYPLEPYMSNLGVDFNRPQYDNYLIHKQKDTQKIDFKMFFKVLIDNRFFNGPTDDEVKEIIHKKHPGLEPKSYDTGISFIQIKVGKHLKSMIKMLGDYDEKALKIPEYREKYNIDEILKQVML